MKTLLNTGLDRAENWKVYGRMSMLKSESE